MLPFRIDYVDTVKVGDVKEKQVSAIATEEALLSPERISGVVDYTLAHFDQKTRRASSYEHSVVTNVEEASRTRQRSDAISLRKRVRGFNAIFATASIPAARRYYNEFGRKQANLPPDQQLKICSFTLTTLTSPPRMESLGEEAFETEAMSSDDRTFLEDAIQDYNAMFGASYDTSSDKFQNYYKDLSLRLKSREPDMVIVVNVFLTGFDATTLNTLFVFSSILRLENILTSLAEFHGEELLSPHQGQDYRSI